jgi:hypothetical protein
MTEGVGTKPPDLRSRRLAQLLFNPLLSLSQKEVDVKADAMIGNSVDRAGGRPTSRCFTANVDSKRNLGFETNRCTAS